MVMEMSKTYQYRKVMKPLLERKRRARINKCLDDLKDLMVECLQQEGEHVTRLEKADILELTVEHMRKLKQRGGLSLTHAQTQSNAHVESFRSGYVHAADQISQVLLQQRQTDEIGAKIMKFLSTRLIDMQHQLLRSSSTAAVSSTLTPPMPTANVNYISSSNLEALSAERSAIANSTDAKISPMNYKQFVCKDTDLIDVTTVDSNTWTDNTDTASNISIDSASSEPVWRPW